MEISVNGEMNHGEVELVEVGGFEKAVEKIRNLEPGVVLFDSDGTCRSHWKALKSGKLGLVPEGYLKLIDELKDKGWKIAMVTNQPYPGHQVAGVLSRKGQRYEAFPYCYEKRDIKIFGGDWRFLTKQYKKGGLAIRQVVDWMENEAGYVPGENVVFVGDRQGDVDFSKRLDADLDSLKRVKMYKVPGFEESKYKVVRGAVRLAP
jgi:histidinol phosphatase-like enzyme